MAPTAHPGASQAHPNSATYVSARSVTNTRSVSGERCRDFSKTRVSRSTTIGPSVRSECPRSVEKITSSSEEMSLERTSPASTLVQSCEVNGIDPQPYLAEVLVRVKRHRQARIDELLPHLWRPSTPNTS